MTACQIALYQKIESLRPDHRLDEVATPMCPRCQNYRHRAACLITPSATPPRQEWCQEELQAKACHEDYQNLYEHRHDLLS